MKATSLMKVIINFVLIIFLLVGTVHSADKGSGGTHSNFRLGVGARALALGNAYVAMPFDASAIYWNPSGLDHIQYKNVEMFYTNLLVGTNYYFLGYVHPTINIGTFGVGIMGYGLDGIPDVDENNVEWGTKSISEQLFLFSYGKQLPWNVSAGINLKLHYQNFLGYTASGLAVDLGFLYRPNFTHFLLSGLSVGMTVQNFIGPRLKANEATDVLPLNVRLGIAKPILVNEWGPQFTFFMDLEQGERVPMEFHAGTEYVYQNKAMLRMGINNSQLTFGAGAIFKNFRLDYSYGKFAPNDISASHRISFIVKLGKSKDELIRIADERRMREIEEKVNQEMKWDRERKITQSMERGKQFLEAEDYARAIREFNFVIKFEDEIPGDLQIEEAKKLVELAEQKSKEQLEQTLKEIYAKNEEEKKRKEQKYRLDRLHEQALAYFQEEDYEKAIEEWNKMLEISPDNPIAKEYIAKAKADLERKILLKINKADALAKRGEFYEAIKILNSIRGLKPDDKKLQIIDQKVTQFYNQLDFENLYRQGIRYYRMKDYKNAMTSFERALALEPGNKIVQKAFFDAKQRANARKETLTGAAKAEYMRGMELYRAGKYEEALAVWEELLKEKPYNYFILKTIDMARERIEQQKRSPNKP